MSVVVLRDGNFSIFIGFKLELDFGWILLVIVDLLLFCCRGRGISSWGLYYLICDLWFCDWFFWMSVSFGSWRGRVSGVEVFDV